MSLNPARIEYYPVTDGHHPAVRVRVIGDRGLEMSFTLPTVWVPNYVEGLKAVALLAVEQFAEQADE